MGIEIERKFLVNGNSWRSNDEGKYYRQGYLSSLKERVVRIRTAQDKGYLTIKGVSVGATRVEYEYEIPIADCNMMLNSLAEQKFVEKKRYKIDFQGTLWEIDEFFGDNKGLIIAEVELSSENQTFNKPDWVGEEVTGDPRYYNSNLLKHPYKKW